MSFPDSSVGQESACAPLSLPTVSCSGPDALRSRAVTSEAGPCRWNWARPKALVSRWVTEPWSDQQGPGHRALDSGFGKGGGPRGRDVGVRGVVFEAFILLSTAFTCLFSQGFSMLSGVFLSLYKIFNLCNCVWIDPFE